MLELFKKYGIPAGIATALTLAITFVPIYYQYLTTTKQNERIAALEQQCAVIKNDPVVFSVISHIYSTHC